MTDDDLDWSGEDWSDDHDDGAAEFDSDDDEEPVNCPECGAAISSYSDKCPQCGYWLTDADRRELRTGESRPVWQRAVATILILGFVVLLLLAGLTLF